MEPESMEIIEVKSYTEIPSNFTGIVKYPNGTQEWSLNGLIHREDGPAIICSDGTQYWCRNGVLHREDGPAVIRYDVRQEWYRNGKLHREDGPALIWPSGKRFWFFNGKEMTPIELFEKLSVEKKEKALWNLDQWK